MTFDDLVKLTRRHFATIALALAISLFLTWAFMQTRAKQYTAASSGYVQATSGPTTGENFSASLLAQNKTQAYLSLFTSTTVAKKVIAELGLKTTPQSLAARVTATAPDGAVQVRVTASAATPTAARDIANGIVTATADYARQLELQVSTGDDTEPVTRIKLVESAGLPTRPSYPLPLRFYPVGALLGLLLGYGAAFMQQRADTRLRWVSDVEAASGTSVLGMLPKANELGNDDLAAVQDFQTREALRKLRTNLRFVDIDHQPRSIVITSANMGEGKSTVAANLAHVLAESGENVLLIDADLRRPAVARIFDLDNTIGLTEVLAGTASYKDVSQESGSPRLTIMTSGTIPPNPSELLGSKRMHSLIQELSQHFFIILDAPPLLPVTDAALLTRSADGAVLVVSANATRKEQLEHAAANLRGVGGKILGTVMNGTTASRLDRVRYGRGDGTYGYGYGYGGSYGKSKRSYV